MKQVMNMGMHKLLQKDPDLWDLFCRKEEYPSENYPSSLRDKHNRFPCYASSYRHIFEPKASEYLMHHGYQVEYPDAKPFAVCLTHDIDEVYESITKKSIRTLKHAARERFSESYQSLKQIHSKKSLLTNFEDIMKMEDRYNARSSFYFLALDPGDRDFSYRIQDLEPEMGTILDRGWEVGLHVSRRGSYDPHRLLEEKRMLEKATNTTIYGCRNHYLKFIVPDTWELLSNAGFLYDCSFGYADCAGFRNGMCHPFRPFNLQTGKPVDIIEIPLVIMDDSLFDNYMRLNPDQAWDITRHLIDTVARYHGVITLLWHNYSFITEHGKFYEKILQYCAEKDAWMTSGETISSWWKHNIKI
jgi:peptidoglycan/xylan/chitin deacetylase (PgdA/CDA1 family)